MFLKSDILNLEKMIVNYHRELFVLFYCRKMIVTMIIILIKKRINRVIRFSIQMIVSTHFSVMIFIHFRNSQLLKNRDYMFFSYQQTSNRFGIEENVLSHIIDAHICAVQVNNILNISIIIDRNSRLNIVLDYEKKDYYVILIDYDHLTADSVQSNASRFNFD